MFKTWLRAGLVLLAATQGATGATQLLLPKTFYENFPMPGHRWVSMLPPYSEHLMRDVGSLTVAMVFVLSVAAISVEYRLVRTVLVANLIFAVSHFVFHAFHLAGMLIGDAIGQTIVLSAGVAIPVVLLLLSRSVESGIVLQGDEYNAATPLELPKPVCSYDSQGRGA